jgi:HEAT repeat protein
MDILLKAVNDKEPGIRANAIRGLGNSGNRGLALPILINLAKSDPDIKVRMESLNVINTLGDPSVLKDLQEITTKDESLRSTLDRIIKRFTKLIEKEKAKQEQEQKKQDEPKNK